MNDGRSAAPFSRTPRPSHIRESKPPRVAYALQLTCRLRTTDYGQRTTDYRLLVTHALMILIIDNYDSFTYNLVQRLGELDAGLAIQVYRNGKITADEVKALGATQNMVSVGP